VAPPMHSATTPISGSFTIGSISWTMMWAKGWSGLALRQRMYLSSISCPALLAMSSLFFVSTSAVPPPPVPMPSIATFTMSFSLPPVSLRSARQRVEADDPVKPAHAGYELVHAYGHVLRRGRDGDERRAVCRYALVYRQNIRASIGKDSKERAQN